MSADRIIHTNNQNYLANGSDLALLLKGKAKVAASWELRPGEVPPQILPGRERVSADVSAAQSAIIAEFASKAGSK